MKTRSPAWKWFALGATVSVVLSVVATFYLVSAKLGQAGADCQRCLRHKSRRASAQYRAADHHRAATGIFVHAARRWMQMGPFDHAFS